MGTEEQYYAIIKERLEKQLGNVDIYNTKANTLLVTASILVAIFWELFNKVHILGGIGLPFVIIAMIILLWAYRIGDWQDAPNPEYVLFEFKAGVPANTVYEAAMADMVECYKANKAHIETKTKRINCASILLFSGIAASLLGLIISLFL